MLSVDAGNGVTARNIRFDTVYIEDLQSYLCEIESLQVLLYLAEANLIR